jgi:S1-C subfamily serine protease
MPRSEEHVLGAAEIQRLMSGADRADLVVDGGAMRLIDVTAGSIAERMGGRNGDILETINGAQLTSVAKGYEAAYAAIKTRRIVITGHRDGEPFVITISIA